MRKYLQYLKYILRHKWFVMMECFKEGLIWRGLMHDNSKFLPSEFIPYANYFYGDGNDIKRGRDSTGYYSPENTFDEDFNIAWLHHQHRNPHHWQYWILRLDDGGTKIMDMPYEYIKEMVCDWKGAGRAITGDGSIKRTAEWYSKNKSKMLLSEKTMTTIEYLLDLTPAINFIFTGSNSDIEYTELKRR